MPDWRNMMSGDLIFLRSDWDSLTWGNAVAKLLSSCDYRNSILGQGGTRRKRTLKTSPMF
jgi:hypothetical protein